MADDVLEQLEEQAGELKIRVAIIFGGKSPEHQVSLQSAKNIIEALDRERFEPVLIGVDKEGVWHVMNEEDYLVHSDDLGKIALREAENVVMVIPGFEEHQLVVMNPEDGSGAHLTVDAAFPVIHGPYGEDGSLQGLLKLANIPFVGPDVLGSAVGMDKDVMKRLLRDAGVPVADFLVFRRGEREEISFEKIKKKLGVPFFVKPANMGSSIGVRKVSSKKEMDAALAEAFQFDSKIVIEEAIDGREIECSVIGNNKPFASLPGEILPARKAHGFYSYEAKYLDAKGARTEAPADLSKKMIKAVQNLAVQTFQVLCCKGMSRVDFFLAKDSRLLVNEINTIPGFTAISMYPKMWEVSGKTYTDLISALILLAMEEDV